MKLLAPHARSLKWLAICLAFLAGYVDAYGLRAFSTYVSFMSGNTTQTGVALGHARLALAIPSAFAIFSFVAGSFIGTLLANSGSRNLLRVLFALVAAGFGAVLLMTEFHALKSVIGISTLSLAMGMMNTSVSRIGGESVSLTFVTGDLNRIGAHLALAAKRAPLPDGQGAWDSHLQRAKLLAIIWIAFLTGAAISAALADFLGAQILILPLAATLALAIFYRSNEAKEKAHERPAQSPALQ
jgi:uncharacterized membrane protein YoaK (UPF0700 family)